MPTAFPSRRLLHRISCLLTLALEWVSLFFSRRKDSEKVVPSSEVKFMTAQERMAYSFSLSCRLSASAQPKDSPKDSEISLLSDTGGGKHDGRFGEAVAKG